GRAESRGAGGAGVGDVEDGDAGLADLLLELLADAGAGTQQVAGGQDVDVLDRHAPVGQRTQGGLGGEVHRVLVGVLAELGHPDAEDPHVVCHQLCSSGSKPKPTASVPALSVPIGNVTRRTFVPSVTSAGSVEALTRLARTVVPPQSMTPA